MVKWVIHGTFPFPLYILTILEGIPLKTDILGIRFDNLTREEARQAGAQLLQSPDFHYVVTPNPEFILAAEKDLEFQKILNKADLVLPDGIGVVYSSKILGTPLKERVAGFDFACDMLEELDKLGGRLYLLGSKPGVAETAAENISQAHPNIVICGTHDGYFKEDGPVAEEIRRSGADCVFVCLAAAWTCSPAWWPGRRNSGPTTGWSGSTACARSPGGLAG